MADRETMDAYALRAEDYADRFGSERPDRHLQRLIAAIPEGGRVLDLGCGPGQSSAFMREAGLSVTSWDASETMATLGQERFGLDIQVQEFSDLNDTEAFDGFFDRYAEEAFRAGAASLTSVTGGLTTHVEDQKVDEFGPCRIERVEDFLELFVEPFHFGCEADDPTNAWAFASRVNPLGARLGALFSSDIGHWDVPDMSEVLLEAWELVEDGLITEEDFRDFTFKHPVSLWQGARSDFFADGFIQVQAFQLCHGIGESAYAGQQKLVRRAQLIRRCTNLRVGRANFF